MKTTFFKKGLWIAMAGVFALLLSACSEGPQESPEEVISKFKSSTTDIQSGSFDIDLRIAGADAQDNLDLKSQLKIQFDRRDEEDRKGRLEVAMQGAMKAGSRSLSGDLGFEFRTLGSNFFIKLNKLESDDENLKPLQPLLEGYRGRWLELPSDFIPKEVQELQKKDAATLEKEEKLKTLFRDIKFFTVTKEFGIETVNGEKTYHYGIELDPAGLQQYLGAVAREQDRELTEKEVENSVFLINSMTELELWIGTKDYYLYKAKAKLLTPKTESNRVNLEVNFAMGARDYNKAVKIERPVDAEEFDPTALLGLSKTSPLLSPALEVGPPGVPEP